MYIDGTSFSSDMHFASFEDYLGNNSNFILSSSLTVGWKYGSTTQFQPSVLTASTWYLISTSVNFDKVTLTYLMEAWVDTSYEGVLTYNASPSYIDGTSNTHTIGKTFIGFIWKLILYNDSIAQSDVQSEFDTNAC